MNALLRRRAMMAAQKKPLLPPEYQMVEYIELPSDFKNAYLITDVISNNVFVFEMGVGTAAARSNTILFTSDGKDTPYCGFGDHPLWSRYYSIEATRNEYGYDWVARKTSNWIAGRKATVGTWIDTNFGASFPYYYVRMKDSNDSMMFDGIPCYEKSTGKVGMYDTVSKKFYSSSGSLQFLKGADIN